MFEFGVDQDNGFTSNLLSDEDASLFQGVFVFFLEFGEWDGKAWIKIHKILEFNQKGKADGN